jgi:uridine kinase
MAAVERGPKPPLIAIDGLPCSGKSTLVERLKQRLDLDCIYLDDFVLPEADWPSRSEPAFPFPYIRYDAFLDAIRTLASVGQCFYHPFDWERLAVSTTPRVVSLSKPVLVEGVSALNPSVCDLYGLKIYVDSDRATTLETALNRGVGRWAAEWRDLFLPSADIYMLTQPMNRADLMVAGRGIEDKEADRALSPSPLAGEGGA